MKKLLWNCSAAIILMLGACERDADVEIPDVPSKLAVFGFIQPNDTFYRIKVEETTPLYQGKINNNQDLTITNATVKVTDGTQTITLNFDATENLYKAPTSSLPVVPGRKYTLMVTDQKGRKVKAETTVPTLVDMQGMLKADSSAGGDTYTTTLTWKDPLGEGNYFRLLVVTVDSYLVDPDSLIFETYHNQLADNYYSDKGKDGQEFSKYQPNKDGFNQFPLYMHPRNLDFWLISSSREYYLYHNSMEKQYMGGGPFAEPTQGFTNVEPMDGAKEGGVGCFGAYVQYRYHF